jgi:hypothetical protein
VVNTWRLSVGTSLFVIDILADGSWRPAYIAPKRLGGWTMDVLPNMPARRFPAQTASSNRTPE